MDEDTKINELEITDEFALLNSDCDGKAIAEKLKELGEGGVVLITFDDEEVIGYVSQQEIVNVVSDGNNPGELPAKELMSNDYVEVMEDETLGDIIPLVSIRYPNAIVVLGPNRKCVGFFSKNDYREVMATLGVYDKTHEPKSAEDWKTKGIALSSKGEAAEAMKCYEKVVETDTNKEKAWNRLAKSLEGLNKVKDAITCYDKVLSINKNNDKVLNSQAKLYSEQKTQNLAIQCYSLALSVNPENVSTLMNLGMEYCNVGNIDEALKYFDKAEGVKGETSEIWYRKGNAYSLAKQHEKAIECFDKAIGLDNGFEDAWFNKSIELNKLGKNEETLKCLEEIIKINPNNENVKKEITAYQENGAFLYI